VAGKYKAMPGSAACITFVGAGTSDCCAELGGEVERLKQEGEEVGSEVERLKQEGEQLGSEVEWLKQQVERLTKVVTPRSSFMPTGNRTMPGWGNSAYTRCQLPFSWTELNKVPSFIRYNPIV
jgi:hypothetical protein